MFRENSCCIFSFLNSCLDTLLFQIVWLKKAVNENSRINKSKMLAWYCNYQLFNQCVIGVLFFHNVGYIPSQYQCFIWCFITLSPSKKLDNHTMSIINNNLTCSQLPRYALEPTAFFLWGNKGFSQGCTHMSLS